MVKYTGHYITFQEVPNEVSLVLTISNCPYNCKGCHSPWLRQDTGEILTSQVVFNLMAQYKDAITCVCFMGTGGSLSNLFELIRFVHLCGYKVCVYSGSKNIEAGHWADIDTYPDYYKVGPYDEELGGLDSPTTNQRFYFVDRRHSGEIHDYTFLFWRDKK